MGNHQYIHRALGSRESPTSRKLVKSMQKSLFLENDATSSRLEAYEPSTIAQTHDNAMPCRDRSIWAESEQNSPFDEQEELRILHMLRLRTLNEIVDYNENTIRFRAFFIRQSFSWAALSIARPLFQATLSNLKVSLPIEEHVLHYGARNREVEIVPPRLKHRVLQNTQTRTAIGYEYLYGLRFFENNGRGTPRQPTEQWSLRQSTVYNRYESDQDGVTWIFITLSKHAQSRIDDYVLNESDLQIADPLDIHLLLLDTALCNWRPYLIDLSKEVDEHTAQVAGMSPDDQGPIGLSETTIGEIMLLDEKLLNALLVAKAQLDNLKTFRKSLIYNTEHRPSNLTFALCVLREQACDMELHIMQLDALRTKLSSAGTLLSSFLDLSSGLALQNLARESRQENEEMRKLSERMHELTEKATRDAAAVKVLTILTLIYLPATVVSNFFSTSFVGTEGPSNGITVSSDWWIFAVVSIPLTVFTLYVWYVWKNYQADGQYPKWWNLLLRRRSRRNSRELGEASMPDAKV